MHKEVEIIHLEFPESIRQRPGMYGCDTTDRILMREVIDNCLDLVLKNNINLDIKAFDTVLGTDYKVVIDNGTGIPLYENDKTKESIALEIFSKINIGSNFERVSYSTGMNGVGLSLVNAVSDHFVVLANAQKKDISKLPKNLQNDYNSGKTVFCMEYKRGLLQHHGMYDSVSKAIDKCNPELSEFVSSNSFDEFGTIVVFLPDYSILDKSTEKYHGYPFKLFSSELIKNDNSFKDTKVSFSLNGETIQPFEFRDHFSAELVDDRVITGNFNFNTNENLPIKFIFQFGYALTSWSSDEDGSVNLLKTPQGIHLSYLHEAMFRAFKRYNDIIAYSDIKYGLRLFSLVFAIEPSFNSQDKTKLSKLEDKGFDKNELITKLSEYIYKEVLANNKEFFNLIIDRIIEYKKQIGKLSNINLLKSAIILGDEEKRFSSQGESSKVYEATSKDYANRELYLTEGLCFTGDQEILDVNLDKISFKDLVEKYNRGEDTYTFSCSKDGEVSVSKIVKAWQTKIVNELAVVTLDNGETIKCTPDHRFMMRDGSYKEAKDLNKDDSLMPLYYDKSGERNLIKSNKVNSSNNKLVKTLDVYSLSSKHADSLVDKSTQDESHHQVHHINHDKKDDNPTNLMWVGRNHHLSLHHSEAIKASTESKQKNPEMASRVGKKGNDGLQEARKDANYDAKYRQNLKESFTDERLDNYKAKMKVVQSSDDYKQGASEKQSVVMSDPSYKSERIMKQYLTTGRNIIEFMSVNDISVSDSNYKESIKVLQKQNLVSNKLTCVPSSLEAYNELENGILGDWQPLKPKPNRFLHNHKVSSVEIIQVEDEPVYDLTVDSDNHNFPLSAGVFVHNSASGSLVKHREKKYQSILPLRGKLVNTSSFSDESLVGNKEILAIINTIGCGVGAIADISKSKYGKVIIATDSDSDGCLRGNTRIQLLDGTTVEIKDLVGEKEFFVYSCKENGDIVPGRGYDARITKHVDKLYKITIDNDEVMECTDNHPFMLTTGKYSRADELKVGDALMPVSVDYYNHKVVNIEVIELDKPEPVYDITVDKYHNFGLSAGVFVHNSHISNLITALFYTHAPDLIKQGLLYKLVVPYYVVDNKDYFYYNEKDKIDFENSKVEKRKGLGSYSGDEAKKFMLASETRKLQQIVYNDDSEKEIVEAAKLMFSSLARRNLMIAEGIINF